MARLRRSNCASPGIARRRRGRGFEYRDANGAAVTDAEVLARIHELAIPPAWSEVWICADPLGHLQATGIDAAGRKQYLYHERWRVHRDRRKFTSMTGFGERLPKLRRRVASDLEPAAAVAPAPLPAAELTRELVLACATRLLDLGFFRIGSEDYAERNESYGLTTMLRSHVAIDDGELVFDFPAKSGQRRVQAVADRESLSVVAALRRRRGGEQLLAYRASGTWRELHAEEVNAYIKDSIGEEYSAKDFRTWNATVLAAVALAAREPAKGTRGSERAVSAAIKTVAAYLGNTPAVARASYVDPRVVDRFRDGTTIASSLPAWRNGGPDLGRPRVRRRVERAVLELLAE